ncbi:MAG: ATP-dependent DNA helicase [Thermofilum sp.]
MSSSSFPYTPRKHQLEVSKEISRELRRRNVILEAPTGFGKTPVVIHALLPYLEKGYRVVWAVRTGSETDRPIEELKVFRERVGVKLFAISFRGKRDMCLLARRFGEKLDYSEVSYICSRERARCPFYRKLSEGVDLERFRRRGALTFVDVLTEAEKLGVCPYFLQRSLLRFADVVSLSYNYVVSEELSWSIKSVFPFRESILVVDEAHNLQHLDLGGDVITEGTLGRAVSEARQMGEEEVVELVEHVQGAVEELFGRLGEEESATFEPEQLLPDNYPELLERALRVGEAVRELRYKQGRRPQSSLYHFAEFMSRALSARGVRGVALIAEKLEGRLHLEILDMRAAEILRGVWRSFRRVIFMSGTLSPLDAFAETVGVDNYHAISVPSPYDEANASVYVVRDLSTRGEELSDEMASKYVEAVARLLGRVRRNTAVFTASYRVQARLFEAGLRERAEELGYEVFAERRDMSGDEADSILRKFKSLAAEGRGLLVAPMGGRFAEGSDYPGEELMCVFLAGIPFEKPTTKTRLYVEYYEELYGEDKGRLYAYVYPALRKAAQALGRALRSPYDQAVLVLGDSRYKTYSQLLPDYVRELAKEASYRDLGSVRLPWLEVRLPRPPP